MFLEPFLCLDQIWIAIRKRSSHVLDHLQLSWMRRDEGTNHLGVRTSRRTEDAIHDEIKDIVLLCSVKLVVILRHKLQNLVQDTVCVLIVPSSQLILINILSVISIPNVAKVSKDFHPRLDLFDGLHGQIGVGSDRTASWMVFACLECGSFSKKNRALFPIDVIEPSVVVCQHTETRHNHGRTVIRLELHTGKFGRPKIPLPCIECTVQGMSVSIPVFNPV
mmetsp:Transcript_9591/g.14076  ORF Transcript_9591/g.14076 Transcript_9591/m.14076 type:complete len:221 (-) Transcript_9591:265-927(-)